MMDSQWGLDWSASNDYKKKRERARVWMRAQDFLSYLWIVVRATAVKMTDSGRWKVLSIFIVVGVLSALTDCQPAATGT